MIVFMLQQEAEQTEGGRTPSLLGFTPPMTLTTCCNCPHSKAVTSTVAPLRPLCIYEWLPPAQNQNAWVISSLGPMQEQGL